MRGMMALSKLIKAVKSDLIVTPIHEQYLTRKSDVYVDKTIAAFVAEQITTPQRNRRATFSASARGSCPRAQLLQYQGEAKSKPNSDLASIFIHGTWTHLKWQAMGLDAGWLAKVEVPCTIPFYRATGTMDGVLAVEGEVGWELKSINSYGYKMIMEKGPKQEHLLQTHFYMIATGMRLWSIVYEDKNSQQWKEYLIPYDPDVAQVVIDELAYVNDREREGTLPPMRPGCVDGSSYEFKNCDFRRSCPTAAFKRKGIKIV